MLLASGVFINPLSAQTVTPGTPQLPNLQELVPPPEILRPPAQPESTPEVAPVLPPPSELLPPANNPEDNLEPTQPELVPGEAPAAITVERFEIVGSTVFSEEQFAEVTQPFVNRPISLAELFQARSAITQLYVENGYITSGAYIPPQTLKDGVVQIQVVEGGLEDIEITGTRRLKPRYIRSRIAIAAEPPLNRDDLLEALQLLQLNPLIENLSAELSAGSRPGQSLLQVRVTEADTFSAQIGLDNARSPSVGTFRRRLQVNEANLLGLGDGLSISYSNTDGSNAVDTSYTLPINPRGGTLSFAYGASGSEVIEEPFDDLDIKASSEYYELTFRQPLIQTPREEFAIGATFSHRESEATLFDGDLPFPSLGSNEDGETSVSALRLFQEWTRRSSREVFALRSQFSIGLEAFNATENDVGPDSRFFSWRGQGQWVRLLAPDSLLLLRADVQLADQSLLALEQFGLGGQDTVRGYRQDTLLTDSGILASAELRLPILRVREWDSVLQLVPFVDVGTTWNLLGREDPDPDTLASIGLGLRWQMSDRLTARFDWGIPLVDVNATNEDTLQEQGLHFSLIYTPF